jgi:trimeric autotransporter adhesin
MKQVRVVMLSLLMVLLCGRFSPAQQSVATAANAAVPPLIQFSNVATDSGGSSLSGVVSITFSLYAAQQGGEPLWTETQNNIQLDATGHYSVQLGTTRPNGVPATLFITGEARWLGVQIAEQGEQPRVLLLSVPYALKAGDAATIGGLPPSAFVLAGSQNGAASTYIAASSTEQSVTSAAAEDVTTTGGTADYLPLFSGADTIIESVLYQTGTGSTAKVGINTGTPATTLDVAGAATIGGTLALPATGAATATAGKASQPLTLAASAYNSSTPAAVNQTFGWQAVPVDNDTATPSATLNLLFGEGTTTPAPTGLHIASNGQITFASGQAFPGTGDGTLTGITTAAGSGLTGGGTSGKLTLGLLTSCASGQLLEWNGTAWACATASGSGTITGVTAGTDLTGGGTSGNVTLNLNTTKIPQLSAANTFVGNQTVTGNLTASGEVQGGVVNATTGFDIGGNVFASGSLANFNAFLGFAGNSTMTGTYNTASGLNALRSNTTGSRNTANGAVALTSSTTGYENVAGGSFALYSNTTGSQNTATGDSALYSNVTGDYNTANGYQALAYSTGNSNTAAGWRALYLNTTGTSNTASGYQALASNTTAGYNTATGDGALYSNATGSSNTASGYAALYSNGSGFQNTASGSYALYTNTGDENTATGYGALYNNSSGSGNTAFGYGSAVINDGTSVTGSFNTALGYSAYLSTGSLTNATAIGANAMVSESNALVLGGTGSNAVNVGIGTSTPSAALDAVALQQVPSGSFTGFTASSGSGESGTDGVDATGGNGDPSDTLGANGGFGVRGQGGTGPFNSLSGGGDGPGGEFVGGNSGNSCGVACVGDGDGIDAYAGSGLAGTFLGSVDVAGTLTAAAKDFKIDHPLDPANKYLVHASVESSEMKNMYDGTVITDSEGQATVQLPEWFEVLNTDFRYQLTVIGQFAQAIVGRKIENNRFEIRTSAPNVEVSWQVTGVRQDAYAKAHPLVVEQEKDARLRGFYIHPELYGAAPEKQIEWARHPQQMKKMKEMQAKQRATTRAAAQSPTAQSR